MFVVSVNTRLKLAIYLAQYNRISPTTTCAQFVWIFRVWVYIVAMYHSLFYTLFEMGTLNVRARHSHSSWSCRNFFVFLFGRPFNFLCEYFTTESLYPKQTNLILPGGIWAFGAILNVHLPCFVLDFAQLKCVTYFAAPTFAFAIPPARWTFAYSTVALVCSINF